MRVVLALIAAYHVVIGALALIAPDTFFDQIGKYGVENSHYVGDVGAFTIAYGCGLALAITRPRWRGPILWLGALWYGFHALNHLFDTGEARSDARGWSDTILLALGAVLSGWLARAADGMEREAGT